MLCYYVIDCWCYWCQFVCWFQCGDCGGWFCGIVGLFVCRIFSCYDYVNVG